MSDQKVYRILNPVDTHFRSATCEEVGCVSFLNGWVTPVDLTTDLGQRQANYIRKMSGRQFTETDTGDGRVAFTFPAGQECFRASEHRSNIGRNPLFLVQSQDGSYSHTLADSWADDLHTHTDAILSEINKG